MMQCSKVVVLRPGALGDVLVSRGVVRYLRATQPGAAIFLAAPGERGAFLCREGWVDRRLDWDAAALAWLFSDSSTAPPPGLIEFMDAADAVVAFVGDGDDGRLSDTLRRAAPEARIVCLPARPRRGERMRIGEWLVAMTAHALGDYDMERDEARPLLAEYAASRLTLPPLAATGGPIILPEGRYLVMHPGSGSGVKNWPLRNFIHLGRYLADQPGVDGEPLLRRIVVTSGEADGSLGADLAGALKGALHVGHATLEQLAHLVAGAWCYIGNDSGVSHLAASVRTAAGHYPRMAVVFGPSDSRRWSPPGATIFEAGADMNSLKAEDIREAVLSAFSGRAHKTT